MCTFHNVLVRRVVAFELELGDPSYIQCIDLTLVLSPDVSSSSLPDLEFGYSPLNELEHWNGNVTQH